MIDAFLMRIRMRTTITIDDSLFQKAIDLSDPYTDRSEIIKEAIKTYVRIQAGKRLAALGGALPDIQEIPRQREAENE
jgi:Arc/MetJ family transcription regulator